MALWLVWRAPQLERNIYCTQGCRSWYLPCCDSIISRSSLLPLLPPEASIIGRPHEQAKIMFIQLLRRFMPSISRWYFNATIAPKAAYVGDGCTPATINTSLYIKKIFLFDFNYFSPWQSSQGWICQLKLRNLPPEPVNPPMTVTSVRSRHNINCHCIFL